YRGRPRTRQGQIEHGDAVQRQTGLAGGGYRLVCQAFGHSYSSADNGRRSSAGLADCSRAGRKQRADTQGAGRMGTRYNVIAGQSLERLAALSDGLFAVAMTLL